MSANRSDEERRKLWRDNPKYVPRDAAEAALCKHWRCVTAARGELILWSKINLKRVAQGAPASYPTRSAGSGPDNKYPKLVLLSHGIRAQEWEWGGLWNEQKTRVEYAKTWAAKQLTLKEACINAHEYVATQGYVVSLPMAAFASQAVVHTFSGTLRVDDELFPVVTECEGSVSMICKYATTLIARGPPKPDSMWVNQRKFDPKRTFRTLPLCSLVIDNLVLENVWYTEHETRKAGVLCTPALEFAWGFRAAEQWWHEVAVPYEPSPSKPRAHSKSAYNLDTVSHFRAFAVEGRCWNGPEPLVTSHGFASNRGIAIPGKSGKRVSDKWLGYRKDFILERRERAKVVPPLTLETAMCRGCGGNEFIPYVQRALLRPTMPPLAMAEAYAMTSWHISRLAIVDAVEQEAAEKEMKRVMNNRRVQQWENANRKWREHLERVAFISDAMIRFDGPFTRMSPRPFFIPARDASTQTDAQSEDPPDTKGSRAKKMVGEYPTRRRNPVIMPIDEVRADKLRGTYVPKRPAPLDGIRTASMCNESEEKRARRLPLGQVPLIQVQLQLQKRQEESQAIALEMKCADLPAEGRVLASTTQTRAGRSTKYTYLW